jgi:hypothetical protein
MADVDATARAHAALASATLQPFRDAWADLDGALWNQVVSALQASAEAHAGILATTGLDDPAAEPAGADLAHYRREVAREVQAPLLVALRRLDPVGAVADRFDGALTKARDAVRALPPATPLPWRDEGLRAAQDDRRIRRFNKWLVRISRRLRSGASRPAAPVRALGAHSLRYDVAPGQAPEFGSAQQSWVRWTAGLEQAWADWAIELLRPFRDDPEQSGEDREDDEDGSPEGFDEALRATRALQEALTAATAASPHDDASRRGGEALAKGVDSLDANLSIAGTLALRLTASIQRGGSAPKDAPTPAWSSWYANAVDRMELHRSLLDLILGGEAVVQRFGDGLREWLVGDIEERCGELATDLRAIAQDLEEGGSGKGLPENITRADEKSTMALADFIATLPDSDSVAKRVRRSADTTAESIHALLHRVPAVVALHPIPTPDSPLRRPAEGKPMRAQEAARQAFDLLRMERIRSRPLDLIETVDLLIAETSGLPEVIGFGCEAAAKELESEEDGARERAVELAHEGLERAATALEVLPLSLSTAVAKAREGVGDEVEGGWDRLVNRALAQRVHAQLLDARSAFGESLRDLEDRIAPTVRRLAMRGRVRWAKARRSLARLVRKGRTLVGTDTQTSGAGLRSARVLAAPEAFLAELPLVYQRLFSLDPVADPGLLAGRDVPLADTEERWLRWREDEGVPLIVVGRPGVGISSFFLVLAQRMEELGAEMVHQPMTTRLGDEAGLAAHLATMLRLDPVDSLAALAAAVLRAPKGSLPEVVALEGLEHLYLRAPGGTDLVERMLTLMAETEPRLFWLVSVTQSAWQLICKSEPTAVSQVEPLELTPLDAPGLRTAILSRHRRSGVPLVFEEPTEGRRLLRRRLRGVRGTAGHQKILEEDFFERLHRSANGSVRLALFQWLRAADFTSNEGELRARPVDPMDFSFMEALDLTQNFTLKALLEHRTLALEEHDRIFRVPRQESFQIVESLRNRHLVEPAAKAEGDEEISEVEASRRYRIPPLLEGAVAAHLSRRNILH